MIINAMVNIPALSPEMFWTRNCNRLPTQTRHARHAKAVVWQTLGKQTLLRTTSGDREGMRVHMSFNVRMCDKPRPRQLAIFAQFLMRVGMCHNLSMRSSEFANSCPHCYAVRSKIEGVPSANGWVKNDVPHQIKFILAGVNYFREVDTKRETHHGQTHQNLSQIHLVISQANQKF